MHHKDLNRIEQNCFNACIYYDGGDKKLTQVLDELLQ